MSTYIDIPVWHLVIFVLGGVAIGAIIVLLSIVATSQTAGGETGKRKVGEGKAVTGRPSRTPRPQQARPVVDDNRIQLDRYVAQRRALSFDEAARFLDVTPRKVRRWLDSGDLKAVVSPDGTRRVTAISIHDLLVRLTVNGGEEDPSFDRAPPVKRQPVKREPAARSRPEPETEQDPEETEGQDTAGEGDDGYGGEDDGGEGEPEQPVELPPPVRSNQKYWYILDGDRSNPFPTLRALSGVLGVSLAGYELHSMPKEVRGRITREPVKGERVRDE